MTIDSITVLLDYQSTTTRPDARMANVIVLDVNREGLGYNDSGGGSPGNREYLYNGGGGYVEFLVPGVQPLDAQVERVNVLFKY